MVTMIIIEVLEKDIWAYEASDLRLEIDRR